MWRIPQLFYPPNSVAATVRSNESSLSPETPRPTHKGVGTRICIRESKLCGGLILRRVVLAEGERGLWRVTSAKSGLCEES